MDIPYQPIEITKFKTCNILYHLLLVVFLLDVCSPKNNDTLVNETEEYLDLRMHSSYFSLFALQICAPKDYFHVI